jgi:hypothetical protein
MKGMRSEKVAKRRQPFDLVWVWVGVAVMSVAALGLFWLDEDITRFVVGVALVVCLSMVGAMVWMDRRESKRVDPTDSEQ